MLMQRLMSHVWAQALSDNSEREAYSVAIQVSNILLALGLLNPRNLLIFAGNYTINFI